MWRFQERIEKIKILIKNRLKLLKSNVQWTFFTRVIETLCLILVNEKILSVHVENYEFSWMHDQQHWLSLNAIINTSIYVQKINEILIFFLHKWRDV